MNILVTGANGQLGNELRTLSEIYSHHHYFFTDIAELDICDEAAVKQFVSNHSIDFVINCAAYTAVDAAEDHPELCDRLNHLAVGYLAQAAESRGASFIQVSTDYVFDGNSFHPYKETDAPSPTSVYGITKLAGEKAALEGCSKTAVIRTSWLYSTHGNNFVKTMIRLGHEREALGIVFDQVGTPTFAADLAQAIMAVVEEGVTPGIYHFSNEGVCSWYDFTVAIHRLASITSCKVRPIHSADYPTKATRPAFSVLDKSKIKQTYQLDIPHWEESLALCISLLNSI